MLLQLSHFPPSLHSILPTPSLPHSPLQFMSMGHTYKFFGFYISYTILNLLLSFFYLPFVLLILCTFPPLPFHFPTDNPPCDLHFCDSVPVLVVCLVHFWFCFHFLGSVVDSCEFVVILLFIVLIIFFSGKSL